MTELDDTIEAMRAVLLRSVKPVDHATELARLQADNDQLHHRVKCLEAENKGLYAKLDFVRDLLREYEGGRDQHGS